MRTLLQVTDHKLILFFISFQPPEGVDEVVVADVDVVAQCSTEDKLQSTKHFHIGFYTRSKSVFIRELTFQQWEQTNIEVLATML